METGVDFELWKNATKSTVVTVREDRLGQRSEIATRGGDVLKITREDRQTNQEAVANKKFDPFGNGLLTPIKVLDPEDREAAAANPNLLTEEDIDSILKGSAKDFAEKLNSIDSEPALRRLVEVAKNEDIPTTRQKLVKERLDQIVPTDTPETHRVSGPANDPAYRDRG